MAADRIPKGFQQTEVGVIPVDWECLPISEIFDFKQGIQCPVENQYKIDRPDLKRFIRIVDLTQKDEPARYILDPGSSHHVDRDDLFMVRYGSPGLLGYGYKGVIANNLFRLVPKKKLVNQFYFHLLTQKRSEIVGVSGSSTMPAINFSTLRTLYLIAPSIAEQTAIATALSDMDALIEGLERLIGKKRAVKQGAMQALLTGKRRLAGFGAGKGMRRTEVGVVPEDWEVVNIGSLTEKIGSGITPTGGSRVYKKEGRVFLRSQNVGWGTLLLDEVVFIDEETHNTFDSTEIRQGDVLLNITGASIGRCAVANGAVEHGNVNQHVCIIRAIEDKLNPEFLSAVILSRIGQDQIDSFQAGGNRQGLNFGQIKAMQIPFPPTLAEQRAIARALNDLDAEIGQLEAQLAKYRRVKEGMMQELLTGKKRLV